MVCGIYLMKLLVALSSARWGNSKRKEGSYVNLFEVKCSETSPVHCLSATGMLLMEF